MSTLYEPLSRESYEVRFLALVASPSARIEFTVQKHSLVFNPPRYVALSYCWGDESIRSDIVVNGQVVSVTANLEEALQGIYTRTGGSLLVWADALCINQADKQELSLQVGIMKQIYEKADAVYAWLGGNGFERAQTGFHSVRALLEGHTPAVVPPTPLALSTASTGLSSILSCPFWQRRWIIQELTAASKVEILCNTAHLSWDDLDQVYKKCSSSECWLEEHKLVAASYHKISQLRREYWQGTLPNLCDAIIETREHLSKDPRDRIYAMLGITSDGLALVPTPNYFQHVGQASEELTWAILKRNANLDLILADPRTRIPNGSLPTWSPDWCSGTVTSAAGFAASRESRHPRDFVASRVPGMHSVLRVQGVTIGTITALTSSFDGQALRASTPDAVVGIAPNPSCKNYYKSRSGVARALVTSLLRSDLSMLIEPDKRTFHWKRMEDAVTVVVFWSCVPVLGFVSRETLVRYVKWLEGNAGFLLDQLSIRNSLKPLYISKVFMMLMIPLVLLDLACLFGLVSIPVLGQSTGTTVYTTLSVVIPVMLLSLPHLIIVIAFYQGLQATSRISDRMRSSQRLFVLDQGAIGLSCNDSRHGDRVCLLAGCQTAIVLRSHTVHGVESYMVVGGAAVCLNKNDSDRFDVLVSWLTERDGKTPNRRKDLGLRTADETGALYSQQDWWESFNLI